MEHKWFTGYFNKWIIDVVWTVYKSCGHFVFFLQMPFDLYFSFRMSSRMC